MGWVILLALGVLLAGAFRLLGVARRLWVFVGAFLMLGASGYAWQGMKTLSGHPVAADADPIAIDPGLVAFRDAILAPSREDGLALAGADVRLGDGNPRAAIDGLLREIARRPTDATLWTGLGYALALHDGAVSPAAKFAFTRAVRLAPGTPGPSSFIGLAYLEAGDAAAARPALVYALSMTPPGAPYRRDIAERIAAIDQFMAMAAARGAVR